MVLLAKHTAGRMVLLAKHTAGTMALLAKHAAGTVFFLARGADVQKVEFSIIAFSGYWRERLGYITTISGPFLVRKSGIGSTLLWAFRTFFVGKRLQEQ